MTDDPSQPSPTSKGQQYNLKWTNYTNNMLQVFSDHLVQESLVDVTLVCEGHLVKAHKIILSACSFYFREIFEVYTDRNPLIILNGVRFCDLKQLIEFMYRGEVKVQDADVEHLLQLAETLQVKGLCSVREKSGGLLTTETSKEAQKDEPTVTKPTAALDEVNTQSSGSIRNSRIRSSKDSINVDLQTCVKTEPGALLDYNSGDDAPLVIDESVDTSQKTVLTQSEGSEPRAKKQRTSKDVEELTTKSSRPPNAFMLFTNEWRDKLKVQYPKESNKEISVRLGNVWKNLSPSAKDRYYEAASKAIADYKAQHPTDIRMRKTTTASSGKGMKYYEAIQLVKLVMPDDNKDGSSSNEVEVVDTRNASNAISNGDNATRAVSSKNK